MFLFVPPWKGGTFISGPRNALRNRCAESAAPLNSTQEARESRAGRHEPDFPVSSASRLRQSRCRVRARRGRLADRHHRRALSRFRLGRCGERPRSLPSASRQGDDRAAQQGLARLQSLQDAGRRAARRQAVQGELRRRRVLRKLRRGSCRVRDQDGAQIPARQRQGRALSHHHLRRRVPRPYACDHRRRRPAEISRRVRPAGRGLRPGRARRPRCGEEGDRPADRGDHDRARAGRGRRARSRRRSSSKPCANCATSTACC